MKSLIISTVFLLLSGSTFAGNVLADLPECKDFKGSVVPNTINQLKVVMRSNESRPQVIVTGTVLNILPEDHNGLRHQKYTLKVGEYKLMIVSNLEFGRIPLAVGKTVTVCGEYKKVGQGMIHWTHFDPHGPHADGFTIVDGKLYGDTETSGFAHE